MKTRTILLLLLGCTFFGVGLVSVLFFMSEEKMQRNNAFQRRYVPHPIEKVGEYELQSNSFYIAGLDEQFIYLGNYNAPLYLMSIDTSLTKLQEIRVEIDSLHLPYRRVKISVSPPYFYLGDGTVPVLFKGGLKTRKASIFSYNDAYFNDFIEADSLHIGITTTSYATRSNAFGLLKKANGPVELVLNEEVLTQDIDEGTFASDGLLHWNDVHQFFIYTYFYKNSFEVVAKDLSYLYTGKTIDTISKPILDIAHYTKSDRYKLGGKSIMVNRQSATYGNYLYIHSDRLGRYEDDQALKSARIIDVYNLISNTYEFSFYLYQQPGKSLHEFRVYKDLLVSIVDNRLWIYRLKPEYFKNGFNAKHTAQYQETEAENL